MTNENTDLPNDTASLQQLVKELRQQNETLISEAEHKNAIQHLHTAELARLYEQVTGGRYQINWSVRDYALAVYQYLDNIIALAPGNLFWMDRNSVLLGCNNTMAKLANLPSRHAVVGKRNEDLPWKEQAAALEAANNRVMETGKAVIVEEPANTTLGFRIYLSVKVPLRNEEGVIIGLLGTSMDITEQKQAIDGLRHAKQQVEMTGKIRSEFLRYAHLELEPIYVEISKIINELLK
ncbi:MAG: PAS domain-containing protein, partial [Gammaproteobacteria bacterium]